MSDENENQTQMQPGELMRNGDPSAKVMIIDDASLTVRLLQTFLEDVGYKQFVTTSNPGEAMELMLAERPDVVLLDIHMPEVSGFDILTELRARSEVAHVPVLILTASDSAADKLTALELGATDFLAKPIDTSELALRLRNTLAAKAYQDRLRHYDALTDLPNRCSFLDRFSDCLGRAQRSGESGAVFHIDLDRFRQLNDSLGHGAGDRLLRIIARRLTGCVRGADELSRAPILDAQFASASRLGGDEFVILLPKLGDPDSVNAIASRIIEAIAEPIAWDNQELIITPSIGILVFPDQAVTVETLLRNMALATNRAKQLGRNRYEVYSQQCEERSKRQISMEGDLHRALTRGELRLLYQPKVDIHSGYVKGAEALLRWENPERGLVSPAAFIPLAEETGLIVPFGQWVLRTACEQLAKWHAAGLTELSIAVNVASLQIRSGKLPGEVREALESTGLAPAALTLELTESAVIENVQENIEQLNQLRELGVRLSLDDFGTGYSSLGYLERLPLDELKIDRSFIARIDEEGDDAPIVRAIIAMARSLGLQVVAEGVEKELQLDYLQRHQCPTYQGYLFGKPMPADEFAECVRVSAANKARFESQLVSFESVASEEVASEEGA